MHSLAPYLVRVFNPRLPGPAEERYAPLDRVGNYDVYEVLKEFIENRSNDFEVIEDNKQVFKFESMEFDDTERTISGWMRLGHYGNKADIINVKTSKVDYVKAQNNAEIINHYMYFRLPRGYNEGVALLHMFRGNGIKTVLHDMFRNYFSLISGFNIQMNPLSYEKAFAEWEKANAKEIRLIRFQALGDVTDVIKNLGHDEQILTLKAPRRKTLGKLRDYFNPDSEQSKMVEHLTPLCRDVRTTVEHNGRKRTFSVGKNASNAICEIEAPEDLEMEAGHPKLTAMKQWCAEMHAEFSESLYKRK